MFLKTKDTTDKEMYINLNRVHAFGRHFSGGTWFNIGYEDRILACEPIEEIIKRIPNDYIL